MCCVAINVASRIIKCPTISKKLGNFLNQHRSFFHPIKHTKKSSFLFLSNKSQTKRLNHFFVVTQRTPGKIYRRSDLKICSKIILILKIGNSENYFRKISNILYRYYCKWMKGLQKGVNCGLARIDFKYFRFMNGTHSCVNMRVKWRESFSGWFSFTETQG